MLLKVIHYGGSFLGILFYYFIPIRKKVILNNLNIAFGKEKSQKEIKKVALENYKHYGKLIFELLFIKSKRQYKELIHVHNLYYGDQALKKNKGIIIIGAHLGNFEVSLKISPFIQRKAYRIARKIKSPLFSKIMERFRTQFGITIIQAKNTYYKIVSLLKKNEVTVFALDQHTGKHGVYVDFFGKEAGTNTSPIFLAMKTGAIIIHVYNFRTPDGHFKAIIEKPFELKITGNKDFDIFYNTQLLTKIIENTIRKHPEQWFWIHKRWKGKTPENQSIQPVIPFTEEAYTSYLYP
ncbi:MAG: lysophospholipid acyltransferase family protein [Deltaproteobacteria bacterium]|nr:lysophospholipid acyltransferase family protein [Deltaproteobacteria bacterium]